VIERQYWLGFNLVAGVGPVRTKQLLERFGSLAEAWQAAPEALGAAGLDARAVQNFSEVRRSIDLDQELTRLDKLGIGLLTWDDRDYPRLLHDLQPIDQSPPLLYGRGSLSAIDEWAVAIVGTRSASPYGRQVTQHIARELAASRLTIISGLARGIDSEAHRAALDVGGRTIAILPGGIDIIYPPENRGLAERIVQQGALVTSYPLGTQAEAKNFAPRNALLSGLARGVLVTEAGVKSGAMLTATAALEQGREVFAIPGNITAQNSSGTNRLIQDGAHPVLAAQDVLDVLKLERVAQYVEARASLPEVGGDEQVVLGLVLDEPLHIDEITRQCDLPVSRISSALAMLELKGLVRQVGRMTYVRALKVR
jgi:DNA processing protein